MVKSLAHCKCMGNIYSLINLLSFLNGAVLDWFPADFKGLPRYGASFTWRALAHYIVKYEQTNGQPISILISCSDISYSVTENTSDRIVTNHPINEQLLLSVAIATCE